MINKLKQLLDIASSDNSRDELLELLLELSEGEVKSYCGIESIEGLENTVVEIAVIKFNRRGSEGVASESYSGASYAYIDDYPVHIRSALRRYRKARFY